MGMLLGLPLLGLACGGSNTDACSSALCGTESSVTTNASQSADNTSTVDSTSNSDTGTVDTSDSDTAEASTSSDTSGSSDTSDSSDSGPLLDVGGAESSTTDMPGCMVDPDDGDAPPNCVEEAPADSFTPEVQWAWTGNPHSQSIATPLVINLTDDNDDDSIDLCDIPEIVVVAYESDSFLGDVGYIYALSGDDGSEKLFIDVPVLFDTEPAVGDIDGDGDPEIITAIPEGNIPFGRLIAFHHDGTTAWIGNQVFNASSGGVALADLDGDGDVEIMLNGLVADGATGTTLWIGNQSTIMTTAADLDGEPGLEVIQGGSIYHADGSPYLTLPGVGFAPIAVADIDGDMLPEMLAITLTDAVLFEHDGTQISSYTLGAGQGNRPAAIHDVDGDGQVEFAIPTMMAYGIFETDWTLNWSQPTTDSGFASSTAFDFLGDGSAEAMYADHEALYIYDGVSGDVLLTVPRGSWTQFESPVVADVDNDGSAEIVVNSNKGASGTFNEPTIQVIRDIDDRWIPARRIWNQFTYHVTNVREDGTIPSPEPKHWLAQNTFRTQVQISEDGDVCIPPVD